MKRTITIELDELDIKKLISKAYDIPLEQITLSTKDVDVSTGKNAGYTEEVIYAEWSIEHETHGTLVLKSLEKDKIDPFEVIDEMEQKEKEKKQYNLDGPNDMSNILKTTY